LAFVLALILGSFAETTFTYNQTALDFRLSHLSVGTWNTMLQPWMLPEWQTNTLNHIVSLFGPEILVLEEVWTEEIRNRILNIPGRRFKYPYHYHAQNRNENVGCNMEDPTLAYLVETYVGCLLAYGVDTTQLQQPLVALPLDCQIVAIGIGIHNYDPSNQLCLACLMNSMEYLPRDQAANSIGVCAQGLGPKYGHKGVNGILILSAHPIKDVKETHFDAFMVNRVNIHATIAGTRFGFGHLAFNLLEDIDPSLAPLMYGALQRLQIQDFAASGDEVVMGDMNTGPDYQPEGYNTFAEYGYKHVSPAVETWCRESHADFLPCQNAGAPPAFSIDHVFVRGDSSFFPKFGRIFNEEPIAMSDHVGVAVDLFKFWHSAGLDKALASRK